MYLSFFKSFFWSFEFVFLREMAILGMFYFFLFTMEWAFWDLRNASHRVSVKILCLAEWKLLLLKRASTQDFNLVGGGVDRGEGLLEALEREFYEETGQELWEKMPQLLHVEIRQFPAGGQFDAAINVFYRLGYETCFIPRLEAWVYEEYRWVSFSELKKLPISEHSNKEFLLSYWDQF